MKILLIEDDVNLVQNLKKELSSQEHIVDTAEDGGNGSFMGRSFEYDVIILDYTLPKKDGITVLREIRAAGKTTPIIFLSVNDDPDIKVSALENGADDYMTKPFLLRELEARLHAVTRRPHALIDKTLNLDNLVLDPDRHLVKRGERRIHLTRKELNLLEYFMKNKGRVLSRTMLMEHVWTVDSNPFSNTVEAHVRNLRMKINHGKMSNLIANIPGRGYVMDLPENLRKL